MGQRLFLFASFFLIFVLFLHPINSGDFFHHLATGRDVIQNKSLPSLDNWTFTAQGMPWVAHSWGAGVIFYAVWELLGPGGISILLAAFGVVTAFFLFLTLRKLKIDLATSLVLVFLTSALISLRWPTRPEVLGTMFMIILIYLLVWWPKRQLLLVPFFWLWGIVYGSSVFLGILTMLFYLIVKRDFNSRTTLIFTACFIASLLNGLGLSSFLYIFQIPQIAGHVGEWLPLHKTVDPKFPDLVLFYQFTVLYYLIFVFVYLVFLARAFLKDKRILFSNIFFLGLSLLAFVPFYSVRFINLAPLCVAPILALLTSNFNKRLRFFTLAFLMLLSFTAIYTRVVNFGVKPGISDDVFPAKLVNFLDENRVRGNIFANQEVSAYLYFLLPDSRVFVDTRDDLFLKTNVFSDLRLLSEGKINIISLSEKYGADIVVGDIGSVGIYKDLFYNNRWQLVYIGDGYFVSLRSEIARERNLLGFGAIDLSRQIAAKPGEIDEAESQMTIVVNNDPASLENQVRLIELRLAQGKAGEVKTILETLDFPRSSGSRQTIVDMQTRQLKGRVYLVAGDCERAWENLKAAEELSYGRFIFYPKLRLATTIDRILGDYFISCRGDKNAAKEYFLKFLEQSNNPLERRDVELKLQNL